jgi:lauroyl/myristoyl acyltransferase
MAEPKAQAAPSPTGRTWPARLATGRRDLALLGSLASLAVVAWCLPERYWDGVCRGLARAQPWRWRGEKSRAYRYVEGLRPRPAGLTPAGCARAHWANLYRERLRLLACCGPAQREPRVRLEGREHLEAALAEGKGAILWVGPFVFSDLLTKVALHDGDFEVSHLSRFSHGFSGSRFGERVLNPIRTRVERRYLAERLVIGRAGAVGALRQLARRLHANRVISISAIGVAHQLYRIPFLNGSIQTAGGAPSLAIQAGAPLLPVFTGRDPGNDWLTVIEPPLVGHDEWDREETVKRLVLQYGALLEYYVTRWPDQFRPTYVNFQTS